MKLRVDGVKVTLNTDKGLYGTQALFKSGLNIIRAENTSGKSAVINGILYALGLDILIGIKGPEAMKPVLRDFGEYGGVNFKVLESFIELEIANHAGKIITIRRYIKGQKNPRLVEVISGPCITSVSNTTWEKEEFFVGMEGAAQREKGFHKFLADFLDLNLPEVKRFSGGDVPLYVECIAPLMFIEQVKGWSGIQATCPQSFGIRNVAKLAVEYILRLDVIENEKRRIQIAEDATRITEDWKCAREFMTQIANQVGGILRNVPDKPATILPDNPWISIPSSGSDNISLESLIVSKRELLIQKSSGQHGKPSNKENEQLLEKSEKGLLIAQAGLSQLRSDIYAESNEIKRLKERASFVDADVQRNKDIQRLHRLGVETGVSFCNGKCPTCNQHIQDSLITTQSAVMDIEENIKFQQSELETINLLISAGTARAERLTALHDLKQKEVSGLLSQIRNLQSDLMQDKNFSITVIHEQIRLQEEIKRLEQLRDEFEKQITALKKVARHWEDNRRDYSSLPRDYFSATDTDKLEVLSTVFGRNLKEFGYRSTDLTQLLISKDNYRPLCDEFEISYGASASDTIRIIWAYTLALLQCSIDKNGNHWGIVVFDEPEQQKMKETSSDSLYTQLAKMDANNVQAIIATSAPKDIMATRLRGVGHNLLEFGDKVIRPMR